ncbi:hypothetical protein [Sorangium sp. So ce1078]|uniref:hypothetical protein n=1 Tax=Sorangium sp. So ce1078 TaxID=3133329 RepID=UPI003F5FD20C
MGKGVSEAQKTIVKVKDLLFRIERNEPDEDDGNTIYAHVGFSDGKSGLSLTGEAAERYLQCLNALEDAFSSGGQQSRSSIEKHLQKAALQVTHNDGRPFSPG